MNEHEFIDRVKSISDDIILPQGLCPENSRHLYQKAKRRKRNKRLAIISAATSFCMALCLVLIIPSVLFNSPKVIIKDNTVSSYDEIYSTMKAIDKKNSKGIFGGFNWSTNDSAGGTAGKSADVQESTDQSASGKSDYSETNTQVQGIDEGDIVKSDGKYLYIVRNIPASHYDDFYIEIVQVDNGMLEKVSRVDLWKIVSDDKYHVSQIREIYVSGNRLIALADLRTRSESEYSVSATYIITYDISDPANPEYKNGLKQDGYYKSSRMVNGYLYTVTQKPVNTYEKDSVETFVPKNNGEVMKCEDVIMPTEPEQKNYAVITAMGIKEGKEFSSQKAYLGSSEHMYMSNNNIYLASNGNSGETEIIRLSYYKDSMEKEAAGNVKGILNNQFSMDEKDGMLRLVTTETKNQRFAISSSEAAAVDSTNHLFILDKNLKEVGSVKNLADDESIYSARFIGNTAYFVTFRQTDPLFSVDLSDPENPKVMGALKIPGFSSYLHPYGENLLLGIGMDGDEWGSTSDMKLSMFDISDPYNVKEIHKYVLEGMSWAEALSNHKAVMIDEGKNLIGFKCDDDYYRNNFSTYNIFGYDPSSGFFEKKSHVNADDTLEQRGFYIGDYFIIADSMEVVTLDMNNNFIEVDSLKF